MKANQNTRELHIEVQNNLNLLDINSLLPNLQEFVTFKSSIISSQKQFRDRTLQDHENQLQKQKNQHSYLIQSRSRVSQLIDERIKKQFEILRQKRDKKNQRKNQELKKKQKEEKQSQKTTVKTEKKKFTMSTKPMIISKNQTKPLKDFYVCNFCVIKKDSKNCFFDDSKNYLKHLQTRHSVNGNLEQFLKSIRDKNSISREIKRNKLSYYLFKGKPVILTSKKYHKLSQILHCHEKTNDSNLFICGCFEKNVYKYTNENKKFLYNPICLTSKEFIDHVEIHKQSNKYQQSSSHIIKKFDNTIKIVKNQDFQIDNLQKNKKYVSMISQFYEIFFNYAQQGANLKSTSYITRNQISFAEIFARNYSKGNSDIFYYNFGYTCSKCLQQFKTLEGLYQHSKTHNSDPQINPFEEIVNKIKSKRILQLPHLSQLSKKDQRFYEFSQVLVKHPVHICGYCSNKPSFYHVLQYIVHICLDHKNFHPLNSHRLAIFADSFQEGEDQAQEQGEIQEI